MHGSSGASSPKPVTTPSPSTASSSSGPSATPATLGYFCIYNPEFGPTDETQHEQLLYYIARKTVSIDVKMRNIGLAQELGTTKRSIKDSDGKYRVITEYLEHEIHDTAISALLRQAYGLYRVANGTMDSLVVAHEGNTRPLQRSLEEFFEPWVQSWGDFEKSMTLEKTLDGINYLPLSKTTNVTMDRLLKAVRDKYPNLITHAMVTFEDQLISSDIGENDLREVWKHIVHVTGYDGASASAAWDKKEEEEARKRKTSTFKFGKSWSNTSIFGFYKASSTPPSTPPLKPISRVSSPVPSVRSLDGAVSSNSNILAVPTATLGTAGSSPRPSGESEIILPSGKAQLNPLWFGDSSTEEEIDEHFGIIYKHKSGLNICFFAPVNIQESQRLIDEPDQFTRELEDAISSLTHDQQVVDLSEPITKSMLEYVSRQVIKEASTTRSLGGTIPADKEIRFVYFNKMNLAIKAQLGSSSGKGGVTIGSDIALSLLDIKEDFDRIPDASEITTRSPSNHWIVGKRFEDREVYMIVSRKDSTLVEVEGKLFFASN
ncbi:vacuolar fusion protein ccz1 [Entomortierella beljakovae]|nr:vacuolar fusion protein ccz1 [Entomortierella beljakovae]